MPFTQRLRRLCTLFLVGLLFALPAKAQEVFPRLLVFGDGFSDTGNTFNVQDPPFPMPPYHEGRKTNGPLWVDELLEPSQSGLITDPNLPRSTALNMAFVNAFASRDRQILPNLKTPGIESQVNLFLNAGNVQPEKDLVILWVGQNDFSLVLDATHRSPEHSQDIVEEVTDQAVDAIEASLMKLGNSGLKGAFVFGLLDLDKSPYVQAQGEEVVELAKLYTSTFNRKLMFRVLPPEAPDYGMSILYFDMPILYEEIFNNPETYGFTNLVDACYQDGELCSQDPEIQNSYLFFDGLHPSAGFHKFFVDVLLSRALQTQQMLDSIRKTQMSGP